MDSEKLNLYNNPGQLYRQCLDYAMTNMATAMYKIDQLMEEEGYAKKHPELIGQVLMASNIDYASSLLTATFAEELKETNKSITEIASSIDELAKNL
ncbi:MAG: hypothetical protein UHK44_07635 [Bacteroidaceae bacterium]|nr:hypothetical protein [Bacteroidaceae bacterium]